MYIENFRLEGAVKGGKKREGEEKKEKGVEREEEKRGRSKT